MLIQIRKSPVRWVLAFYRPSTTASQTVGLCTRALNRIRNCRFSNRLANGRCDRDVLRAYAVESPPSGWGLSRKYFTRLRIIGVMVRLVARIGAPERTYSNHFPVWVVVFSFILGNFRASSENVNSRVFRALAHNIGGTVKNSP